MQRREESTPGWVVGWMNSNCDYFVFAVLEEESVKVVYSAHLCLDSRLILSGSTTPAILSSRHLALFTYDLYESRPLEVIGVLSYTTKNPHQTPYIPSRTPFKLRSSYQTQLLYSEIHVSRHPESRNSSNFIFSSKST